MKMFEARLAYRADSNFIANHTMWVAQEPRMFEIQRLLFHFPVWWRQRVMSIFATLISPSAWPTSSSKHCWWGSDASAVTSQYYKKTAAYSSNIYCNIAACALYLDIRLN